MKQLSTGRNLATFSYGGFSAENINSRAELSSFSGSIYQEGILDIQVIDHGAFDNLTPRLGIIRTYTESLHCRQSILLSDKYFRVSTAILEMARLSHFLSNQRKASKSSPGLITTQAAWQAYSSEVSLTDFGGRFTLSTCQAQLVNLFPA